MMITKTHVRITHAITQTGPRLWTDRRCVIASKHSTVVQHLHSM